jgi:uncharacterized membrane protein YkoI
MKLKNQLLVVGIFASVPLLALAADSPKKGEITMERAKEIAMKNVKGTIKSSEYEFEKGQNVYSFDIDGSDGKLHEVLVGAKHGKIVSSTIETAAKEAAELKADEKAH